MRKWYIKDRFGRYMANTGVQFSRVWEDVTGGYRKEHNKKVDINHSKRGAKAFDKQKNALEFVRRYPELKAKHEKGEIFLVEE